MKKKAKQKITKTFNYFNLLIIKVLTLGQCFSCRGHWNVSS